MRRKQVDGPHQGVDAYIPSSTPPDGKIHVPKILSADPAILPWKVQRAIEYYLDIPERNLYSDVEAAGKKAGMIANEFAAFFRQVAVQEIIKKKSDLIDQAIAERRAAARVLSEDFLDSHTAALLDSKETPASVKATVLSTGYKRFGMLKEKVEATGAGGAPLAFSLVRIQGRKDTDADAGS